MPSPPQIEPFRFGCENTLSVTLADRYRFELSCVSQSDPDRSSRPPHPCTGGVPLPASGIAGTWLRKPSIAPSSVGVSRNAPVGVPTGLRLPDALKKPTPETRRLAAQSDAAVIVSGTSADAVPRAAIVVPPSSVPDP